MVFYSRPAHIGFLFVCFDIYSASFLFWSSLPYYFLETIIYLFIYISEINVVVYFSGTICDIYI